jgi:PPOX class probable F420-dependent enzyme
MRDASPPASHLDLLKRPLFAHVATLRPDGSLQSNVMWFAWDGHCVQLTHSRGAQKYQNLSLHPALSLSISDPDNPYRYLEVRGQLDTIENDLQGTFFAQLAERYHSPARLDASQLERRVRLAIQPTGFYAVGS